MKKILLALLVLTVIYSCKKENNADTNLHITGTVKGLKQGKIYIKRIVDTSLVTMDSIIVKGNSTFESHLKIDSPEMLYLILDRGHTTSVDDKLPFFAEPGNMKIMTSMDGFYSRAKITGSENQKLYENFQKLKSRYTSINLELVQQNIEATQSNDVKKLDSIEDLSEKLLRRRYFVIANFAKNHADQEVGPYIALSEIYDMNIKYLDTIHNSMSPEVAKSHYGKMLTEFIENRKKEESAEVK